MISKPVVQVIAAIVVLVFSAGIIASGGDPSPDWLKYYSYGVTAAMIALAAWEKYLWRLEMVQKLPWAPIDVSGTWRGMLESSWHDPETGEQIPPKMVFLVIRQTASTTKVTLLTDESRSSSALSAIVEQADKTALDYLYLNEPRSGARPTNEMHHGSSSLNVTGRPATRLHGRYWTDRQDQQTRGELDFTTRSKEVVDDYESAQRLLG